ncbi:MAG: aldehyde dehydrogenase family protein [Spirochaetes bacterium]|nr:aldehyde dehydrogenase family protein [Spirochaetota bacterium]
MLPSALPLQREVLHSGKTRPLAARLAALKNLRRFLTKEEEAILQALHDDLGKPAIEAFAAEIGMVLGEIDYALENAGRWMASESAPTPWASWPARTEIRREPRGNVLILSPWNYPLFLSLAPAVGALACGNTVMLKPSESAPATERLLATALPRYFPPELFAVATGDASVAKELLAEPWGLIVFTGGTSTGKAVMAQAASTLSPVLLELGGQNPTVIAADADPMVSARRILWGKGFNAGQTCLAPDHLWVHASIKDRFLECAASVLGDFYGANPFMNPEFGRLINDRHFGKVKSMLDAGIAAGARIVHGGRSDAASRKMEVTLLDCPAEANPALAEENFGPILPVLTWEDPDRLARSLRSRPAPLGLYVFTRNRAFFERLAASVPSGAAVQNGVFSQILSPELPFGGVGGSGFGRYRGDANASAFSVTRPVIRRGLIPDITVQNPPMRLGLGVFKRLMPWMLR